MKQKAQIALLGIFIVIALLPAVSLAQQGTGIWAHTMCSATSSATAGGPVESCGFCDILVVAQNIIVYLTEISATISAGMIVYGALRMMVAGGSEGGVSAARQTMINAAIGFVITLAAWIVVNTLLSLLSGSVSFPWSTITCTIK